MENKILNFFKKIGLKLLKLLKFIGAKILVFCKKILAKIQKAIREKKCGRPLVIELPFYVLKDAFKFFYKGAKEGNIAYKIKRDMYVDCDIVNEPEVEHV